MGIELNFNPGSPHIFKAPQSLTYTEQAGQLTGSPSLDMTKLAWNDDITVTAQAVNPSVDSAVGSLSTLHLQPSDSSIIGDVATRKVTVTIDGGGGGGQSANRVTGLHARAEMTTAGDGTTITSLAAIRAGVNVTSAGAGSITELSAIEIEAPSATGFASSTVGLRIKNHGTNPAIKTGTGPVQFGDTVSCTSLNATAGIGAGAAGFFCNGPKVVGARNTGWTPWTGASSKASFDTSTATLANVAQSLKALLDALTTHGLIGA